MTSWGPCCFFSDFTEQWKHFCWDLRENNISIIVHITQKFNTCGENKGKHCQSSIFTFHLNPIFLFRTNCKKTYSLRDDLVYYGVEKNICKLETPEDSLLPSGHASLLLLLPGVSEYFRVLLSHLASWARGQDMSSIYHLQDNVITRQIIGRFLTWGQRFWICWAA